VWLVESTELWASSRQTALRMVAYDGAGAGGPSVVALHGMVTGVDVLRETVPGLDPYARLAAEGLNVLALDWPGHGRSGGARGHLTYRLAIEATATAVESCQQRWGGPVGAFGTALGGVLVLGRTLNRWRLVPSRLACVPRESPLSARVLDGSGVAAAASPPAHTADDDSTSTADDDADARSAIDSRGGE
jgi:alpha-beta hydrolase superfamily lysophospholipase